MNDYTKFVLAQRLQKEYEDFNDLIKNISELKGQINEMAEEAKFRLEKSASLVESLGFEKNEAVKIDKLEWASGLYRHSATWDFEALEEFEQQLDEVLTFKEK